MGPKAGVRQCIACRSGVFAPNPPLHRLGSTVRFHTACQSHARGPPNEQRSSRSQVNRPQNMKYGLAVVVANYVSKNGASWARTAAMHNSGTYNNQCV